MEEPTQFQWQGETLLGVHHREKDVETPGVIFIHGLFGNRVDIRRLFVRIARRLQYHHIASLRIDLQASGVSDGAFHLMTYSTQLAQICHVIDEVQRRDLWRGPLILFAGSQGARLAIAVAHRRQAVAGICLWSGMFATENVDPSSSASASAVKKRAHKIEQAIVLDTWWGVWCNRLLFVDFQQMLFDSKDELPAIPFLGVYGGNDTMTRTSRTVLEQAGHNVVVIPDADHVFSNRDWEDVLIQQTETWIRSHFSEKWPGEVR